MPVQQIGDNIWIGDLPVGMDKNQLSQIFEVYGQVVDCRMLPGRDESAKPCAMLRFASTDMAQWVVENLNGNIPEGLSEPIICRFANAPSGKGKGGAKGAARAAPYATGKGAWTPTVVPVPGAVQSPPQSDNIWVGDLPLGTAENDLHNIFAAYGQIVTCKMLPGRDPNAKPCAMIRFSSVDSAAWIVENLNRNIPEGLEEPIVCRFANAKAQAGAPAAAANAWRPQPWHSGGGMSGQGKVLMPKGGAGKGASKSVGKGASPGTFEAMYQSVKKSGTLGGGKAPEDCQCYVQGLPSDTSDYDLYRLFSPFGAIPPNGVKAMTHPDGTCKGIGFVDYSESTAAQTAVMALDSHTLFDGTVLKVSVKKSKSGGQ